MRKVKFKGPGTIVGFDAAGIQRYFGPGDSLFLTPHDPVVDRHPELFEIETKDPENPETSTPTPEASQHEDVAEKPPVRTREARAADDAAVPIKRGPGRPRKAV